MEAEVCGYVLEGSPVSYMGTIDFESSDKLVLKNVLWRLAMPKQSGEQTVLDVSYRKAPLSGRDSTVHIDLRASRGVLVKNLDQEDIDEYRNAHTRLHSKLHLAPL